MMPSSMLFVMSQPPMHAAKLMACLACSSVYSVQGYCVPGCAEDVIGFTFYKYVLTNAVSINGVELLTAIAKKCLHMDSHVEPPWVSCWVILCNCHESCTATPLEGPAILLMQLLL